ncbi:hypothetical protein QCA50_001284 [Cerrena zonata]|uniref:Uncharacterized protein n=1 Tax=Cerrena zonata TaxID=2478898 RepID=A0AAW0GVE2_9APHY
MSEKNGYLQKELDNAVREARGQISLLNNKVSGILDRFLLLHPTQSFAEMERDLELERRRSASLQDSLRDREKEYQKLKVGHLDKIKRKALLAPGTVGQPAGVGGHTLDDRTRPATGFGASTAMNVGAVVGGMEANGIQRTPITTRTAQQGQPIPTAPIA